MTENPRAKESVFWVEISKIRPNPMQPRRAFDEAALEGLAESIREYGILQPLVVSRMEDDIPSGTAVSYELIAGERRLRAAERLGLREVPVVIRAESPARVKLELALVENLQREDLNSLERAYAFRRLIDEFGMRLTDIGIKVGKTPQTISNTLRLLKLPYYIKEGISQGSISEGHARSLLMLMEHKEEQKELFEEILVKNLSVRQAERISRRVASERALKKDDLPDPETRQMEERLSNFLGTRVFITRERGGKGRISIDFFSPEELQGITQKLEGAQSAGILPESFTV